MKIIICFTILLALTTITFSQSVLNYQTGTGVVVQPGADVCADNVIVNGTFSGGGTICGGTVFTLSLTAFIEAFYNPSLDIMVSDTARVYLRNTSIPYSIVDSSKSVLDVNGAGTFIFFNVTNGPGYYIVVKHRNSIETWSSSGNSFLANALAYDFSTANTQAFGNNLKQVDASPLRFADYSGDVNQDGFVNLSDIILIFNDATAFVTGYVKTDVNGDNFTNLTDLIIANNNSIAFVQKVTP